MCPAYRGILWLLAESKDDSIIRPMVDELERSLNDRLKYVPTDSMFSLAALLNPRYGLKWVEDSEVLYFKNLLRDNLKKIKGNILLNINSNNENTPSKSFIS
ncbi:unnamed protein product [Brachionus calyciflorus]|uniref:Uncharacterized protein n=1 Tax=Brachionus calyciflorus TaxID=104777 RepID=A0A814Q0X5_9BILA|nr:unnamed protein product [Brachionus calyciflorus]